MQFSKRTSNIWWKQDIVNMIRLLFEGQALELITGINKNYDAAWKHMESIYGDPRFVADTITQDIA